MTTTRELITRETLTITPRIAEEMLERNINNRNLRARHVEFLAGQMRRDEWEYLGDPIRFDKNGRLLDGQHRLKAIATTGIPQTLDVIRGLDPRTRDVMDTGTKRTAADMLRMDGYANHTVLAAATVVLHAYENGWLTTSMSTVSPTARPTHVQQRTMVETEPLLLEGVEYARAAHSSVKLPLSPLLAAWVILARLNREKAIEFYQAIRQLDGSAAVSALARRVMLDRSGKRRRYTPATVLFLIFRTWNAWISNEGIQKLQLGSEAGGWTIMPTPDAPKVRSDR